MSRRDSAKIKRDCFAHWRRQDWLGRTYLECYRCTRLLYPNRDRWIAEHEIVRAHGGSDGPDNVKPCCPDCDREKTPRDLSQIAKGKRQGDFHWGIRKSSGRPMAGSRNSAFKRKMNGEVVRR